MSTTYIQRGVRGITGALLRQRFVDLGTVSAVSRSLGISRAWLRKLMRLYGLPQSREVTLHDTSATPSATDALCALATMLGRTPTAREYEAWATTNTKRYPSLTTVRRLYGSYNEAVQAAGLTPRTRGVHLRNGNRT